ncbi:radical SAM protein [Frankia sp. B2]|nr:MULTISPECIES: radical SAM protein [unclassified Frankia]ETA02420.1 hypothetical protein CcI6DRAFT_02215 [Frankia sp. CcI6]KFB04712.1 radical SAM superfamily enzyme [Frankia sp. Allo2]OFB44689.1 radical SAM protein [Frankia sp. CgIM4]OHV55088.1 radical SAM protein [Frankia sp. CgIS1]ORT51615.1 radical SAM protein [Frankia sp. KB5]
MPHTEMLWLEITGRCQLACSHCYAESGPTAGHGTMTVDDWHKVIDDAAGLGVRQVAMIGGEPTLHPALPDLVGYALAAGLTVEIFSNLVRVPAELWPTLMRLGVRLATSYYAASAADHDRVTGRAGSHALTRANLIEVLRRSIPLRVGIVGGGDAADRAHSDLLGLGVTNIRRDVVRAFGRAAGHDGATAGGCGHCGLGRAAVLPDGRITPCVMSRGLDGGNVRDTPLAGLLAGKQWQAAVESVPRSRMGPCDPDSDHERCGPVHPEPDPN